MPEKEIQKRGISKFLFLGLLVILLIVTLSISFRGMTGRASQDFGLIQCKDGMDNDKDGKVDYPNDPECLSPEDDQEEIYADIQFDKKHLNEKGEAFIRAGELLCFNVKPAGLGVDRDYKVCGEKTFCKRYRLRCKESTSKCLTSFQWCTKTSPTWSGKYNLKIYDLNLRDWVLTPFDMG